MPELPKLVVFLAIFLIVALASRQIGDFFNRYSLPLISGFLVAGLVSGPFVLDLVPIESLPSLQFINETALAFIAFAAGGELQLKFVRGRLGNLFTILMMQMLAVLVLGALSFILLAEYIPFMREMSQSTQVITAALLGSVIMVARSPSSTLAIIKEVRAKGHFTSTVLGVTVIKDAVVIIVFATVVSISAAILEGGTFSAGFLLVVLLEILLDLGLGILVGLFLRMALSLRPAWLKAALILLVGFGVFGLSSFLHDVHLPFLPLGIFSEPLLICMTAGFVVANYTRHGTEFRLLLENVSPPVFIAFFTLVGISLELDLLIQTWFIAVILVGVRLAGLFVGSIAGGLGVGDPMKLNLLAGFAYITQAGVSVGLAKEIGVEFPPWGEQLATLSIGVIVINQLIGPPFFKWAITRAGEAHPPAERAEFDGVRDAIIFGLENQSLALARQLIAHEWQVKIVCQDMTKPDRFRSADVDIICTEEPLGRELFERLQVDKADALVALLSDQENLEICRLNYEHFGVDDMIVLLNESENLESFNDMGALIVDPRTALVSLLDHLVRSPVAASLILGMEEDHDIIDLEVRDPALNGVAIRDLRLPHDVVIMSLHRDGLPLVSLGYTRLKLGDRVSVVGPVQSLAEATLLFDD